MKFRLPTFSILSFLSVASLRIATAADSAVVELDPGGALRVLTTNSNDAYIEGRGSVFKANDPFQVTGAGLWADLPLPTTFTWRLWETTIYPGSVNNILLATMTTSLPETGLRFYDVVFAQPITLTMGGLYHVEVMHASMGTENSYYEFNIGNVNLGMLTVQDGTASGLTDNAVMPLIRLHTQAVPEPSPIADNQSVAAQEDTPKPVILTASDGDGGALTYTVMAVPQHGSLSGTAPNLTFTPAADYHGDDSFTFKANDGAADSNVATVAISITSVNDVPTLTALPDFEIFENAGTQLLALNGIGTGAANEFQTLTVTAVSSDPALISDPPIFYATPDTSGSLTLKPVADANGTATITVTVDDGDPLNRTVSRSFTVKVMPVNDAPSFIAGPDISVARDAGPQTITDWASGISAGPPDEVDQSVQFSVSVNFSELFSVRPAIAPNGTLTFTPAPGGSGTATVEVTLSDSGGTADGGVNLSAVQTFRIAITSHAEEFGTYNGLIQTDPAIAPAHERSGVIRLRVKRSGVFTGTLRLASAKVSLSGRIDEAGVAHFGNRGKTQLKLAAGGLPNLALTLRLDVENGTDKLSGAIIENGNPFAVIDADRALYTAEKNPKPPYRHVPVELLGRYTVAFSVEEPGRDPASFPPGHGVGLLSVRRDGLARLTATLPDGTAISCANALSKDNAWPFYVPLASGRGSIGGLVQFRDVPDISDLDGPALHWFKPARPAAKRYTAGWMDGLRTSVIGSKFVLSPTPSASMLPGLGPIGPTGNAELRLSGGGLPTDGLSKLLNINPRNRASVIAPGEDRLHLRLETTGFLSGDFFHPARQRVATFKGAVLQKQKFGCGFFLGASESGSMILAPSPSP